MLKWLHHLLEPHCEHCQRERELALERQQLREERDREEVHEEKVCKSCETLQKQLEIANYNNQLLMSRLLEKPAPEPKVDINPEAIKPRTIPWQVRKQMLMEEDRALAATLARKREEEKRIVVAKATEAVIGNKTAQQSVQELEHELGVADGAGNA